MTRATLDHPLAGEIKHVPAATGQAYRGPGTVMTFLITGEETGGAFFLSEISVPPNAGPPPHIHSREDESFQILEGTLVIQVGGRAISASPGDFVFLPRGVLHTFRNTGAVNAKALVITTPAGLENYFKEVFDPAADRSETPPPPTPAMLARAKAVAPKYGLELLPPV